MASEEKNNHRVNPKTHKSRSRRRDRLVGLLVVCGVFIFVGCSSETKHKWMSRFFDGVPPLGGATNVVTVAAEEVAPTNVTHVVIPEAGQTAQLTGSVHPPFADNSCAECHESKFSQKMKGPMNSVCFSCHDDFLAPAKIKHAPAQNGECTACHSPHDAPNKKLLIRTGRAMCLECHDDPVAQGKVKHQPVEADCLDCHSPHASNVKGILKKPLATLCFECHDDFLKEAKFKHDPAGNGECMSCHTPHQSDNKELLIKPSSKLCFECHEESDLAKVDAHKQSTETDCLKCHDPHGGSDKWFLKAGARKTLSPAAPAKGQTP